MRSKILNSLLIITPLLGYLEWGKDSHSFLFQVEADILSKVLTDPKAVLHPMTILPLIGQVILFVTLFQNAPNKKLTYFSIGCIGILVTFIFVIGLLTLNVKIFSSAIPFITVSALTIRHYRSL
jgi:cobalamin biosynthesis protein CobD/CbiB